MTKGSTDAEKAKWKAQRARPKKLTPDELHARAVARQDRKAVLAKWTLEMRTAAVEGDKARRKKRRDELNAAFERGLRKVADLGVPPVYRGHARSSAAQRDWVKREHAWMLAEQRSAQVTAKAA